jgi:hypothetical protein
MNVEKLPEELFPLQEGPDCVIECFLTAYQLVMSKNRPYLLSNRRQIVNKLGGPADFRIVAKEMNQMQKNVEFVLISATTVGEDLSVLPYPRIVLTWRDSLPSHCIVHVNETLEYDPGKGTLQKQYGNDKTVATHYAKLKISPPPAYRWYERIFYYLFGHPVYAL